MDGSSTPSQTSQYGSLIGQQSSTPSVNPFMVLMNNQHFLKQGIQLVLRNQTQVIGPVLRQIDQKLDGCQTSLSQLHTDVQSLLSIMQNGSVVKENNDDSALNTQLLQRILDNVHSTQAQLNTLVTNVGQHKTAHSFAALTPDSDAAMASTNIYQTSQSDTAPTSGHSGFAPTINQEELGDNFPAGWENSRTDAMDTASSAYNEVWVQKALRGEEIDLDPVMFFP